MNPNEISQNIVTAMAKGHAYDQLVLEREVKARDGRIASLEREVADLKRQLAAVVPPVATAAAE